MKERPILFNAPMVRAIIEGRKSQTRRELKPQPPMDVTSFGFAPSTGHVPLTGDPRDCDTWEAKDEVKSKYGQVGDQLWVREPFKTPAGKEGRPKFWDPLTTQLWYTADPTPPNDGPWSEEVEPLYLPRQFARIILEITDIRVERLQNIGEKDARREGLEWDGDTFLPHYRGSPTLPWRAEFPVDAFKDLWESIKGPESWEANPWVWVISFKRVW